MIHSYQVPNYWTWKIFLCVTDEDESLSEIAKYYNNKYGFHINEGLDGESPCCMYDNEDLIAIVCINKWEFNSYYLGTLAHEILHMLICISYTCECPINVHTSECWAYTMNSFMETFVEILNTHHLKKGKRRHARRNIRQRSRKRHSLR